MIKMQASYSQKITRWICVLAMIFTSVMLGSCSDTENSADSKPLTDVALESMGEFSRAIITSDTLIELYQLISDRQESGLLISKEELNIIERKWKSLLAGANKHPQMSEEVDVVDVSYKRPLKKGDRYIFSLLFRVRENLPKDFLVNVLIYPDESHLHYLPESSREAGYAGWAFEPHPKASKWLNESISIAGDSYLLQSRGIIVEEIPYRIKVFFYWTDKNGRQAGIHGKRVDLGWYADPGR